jgi:flagellar biosynthesis protein FliP
MNTIRWRLSVRCIVLAAAATTALLGAGPPPARARTDPGVVKTDVSAMRPLSLVEPTKDKGKEKPKSREASRPTTPPAPVSDLPALGSQQVVNSVSTVGLFALISLAPAAVLMVTAFVRINLVLVLLRQALGSPQVPGNQVLTALALLLTALVMRPVGEVVYDRAIEPYATGKITWSAAYKAGSGPVKAFMLGQIERTNHADYLWAIHDEVAVSGQPAPVYGDDFSLGVVATAYLLSELTTALVIGFYLYLPFLVVDLVVSAVLAAMGLFMLPPSLVALPLKLILFVLVNGWLHVATMLLQSFGPVAASP